MPQRAAAEAADHDDTEADESQSLLHP
eukprot:COSAG01_NODE_40166_length_466_cov_204.193460_2_plen_26_part_01